MKQGYQSIELFNPTSIDVGCPGSPRGYALLLIVGMAGARTVSHCPVGDGETATVGGGARRETSSGCATNSCAVCLDEIGIVRPRTRKSNGEGPRMVSVSTPCHG